MRKPLRSLTGKWPPSLAASLNASVPVSQLQSCAGLPMGSLRRVVMGRKGCRRAAREA
jgi:hypothetical protein